MARLWAVICSLTTLACGSGGSLRPEAEARRLAGQVSSGAVGDCEALARFAEAAGQNGADRLVEAFNPFVPRRKANFPLGWPIGLIGVDEPVKLEGAVSGYRAEFRKEYEPGRLEGTNHDQAHHFAPYFILGARVPRTVAMRFLEAAERPESWGDLNLGREAIELGGLVARGELAPKALGAEIRARLCE
jgi:hypothetical protein